MKNIPSSRRAHYLARVCAFLIMATLIAGMIGCSGDGGYNPHPSKDLEIRTWHDLDDVRDNPEGNHTLMNDLNSTTLGYEELASPTANDGKGWDPIGTENNPFMGSFDGQGYKICDLFIDRPGEIPVGLFFISFRGHIENIGVVNVTVTGGINVGSLVGVNGGTVSNSYSTGNVTGSKWVGGLVGDNYGTMSNSYSTGNVTGDTDVGGLVGYNFATVSNSFWDIETSGQNISAGGTGKNTTEMQNIATFSDAGWNITAVALNETNPVYIWNIVDNVTYPFLSWEA